MKGQNEEALRDLKRTAKRVMVAFAGPEMILHKLAGADDVGTGKFFNLRRYSPGRYEEPTGGGGQIGYYFVESLLAFLRTADLLLLQREGQAKLLSQGFSDGVWARQILESIRTDESKAWVGLAWRQYLSWFWRMEERLSRGDPTEYIKWFLKTAEVNWRALEDADLLLDEPRNNGAWIRPWRQAVSSFNRTK